MLLTICITLTTLAALVALLLRNAPVVVATLALLWLLTHQPEVAPALSEQVSAYHD